MQLEATKFDRNGKKYGYTDDVSDHDNDKMHIRALLYSNTTNDNGYC